MGVIDGDNRAAQKEGPECPSVFIQIFRKYQELKFTKRATQDAVKLYARDTLGWQDLVAYSQITKQDISIHESELIMGLDAIFEGREDG